MNKLTSMLQLKAIYVEKRFVNV